jgi:hypothetical protein
MKCRVDETVWMGPCGWDRVELTRSAPAPETASPSSMRPVLIRPILKRQHARVCAVCACVCALVKGLQ